MLDFTNQVVLETGAGSAKGMGRVLPRHLANRVLRLLSVISTRQDVMLM